MSLSPRAGPCSELGGLAGAENNTGAATRFLGKNSIPLPSCGLFPVARTKEPVLGAAAFRGGGKGMVSVRPGLSSGGVSWGVLLEFCNVDAFQGC